MVNFIVGLILGATVGVCVAALCQTARDDRTDDLYRRLYRELLDKPNCNNCGDRECPYKPEWGGTVRVNCPLWVEPVEDE